MAFDELMTILHTTLAPSVVEAIAPGQVALRASQFVTEPVDVQAMTRRADLLAMAPADRQLLFSRLAGRVAFLPQQAIREAMVAHLHVANAELGANRLDLEAMLACYPADGVLPPPSQRLLDRFVRGRRHLLPMPADVVQRRQVADGLGEVAFLAYWLHCHAHPDLDALLGMATEARWPYLEDFALDTDRLPHEVESRLDAFAAEVNR